MKTLPKIEIDIEEARIGELANQLRPLLAQADQSETLLRHKAGQLVLAEMNENETSYGKGVVRRLAEKVGVRPSVLYQCRDIAEAFSEAEIKKLIELRTTGGRWLSFNIIFHLAELPTGDRQRALDRIVAEDMPVRGVRQLVASHEQPRTALPAGLQGGVGPRQETQHPEAPPKPPQTAAPPEPSPQRLSQPLLSEASVMIDDPGEARLVAEHDGALQRFVGLVAEASRVAEHLSRQGARHSEESLARTSLSRVIEVRRLMKVTVPAAISNVMSLTTQMATHAQSVLDHFRCDPDAQPDGEQAGTGRPRG